MLGKSYIIAIYCCIRAVLYPNSKIIIAAGSKSQSKLILTQKIMKELLPSSEALQKEISEIKTSGQEAVVKFHNGSFIECVTSTNSARGYRATTLILDEFRLIKKDILDSVLRKFLIAPRYLPFKEKNPEYANYPMESNKEIYISSAWYKSHWAWAKFKDFTNSMLKGKDYFVCDFPYTVSVDNGLLSKKQVEAVREEEDMNEISWQLEMEGIFYGENSNAFFKSDELNRLRVLNRMFYPPTEVEWLQSKKKYGKYKCNIPKMQGEKRIIGCDIALAKGVKNDNSVFTCMRLIPEPDGTYTRELVHMETYNGMSSNQQALKVKRLYYDFEADFIIIDSNGVGVSVFNELQRSQYDEERDIEYRGFTCFNDDNTVDKTLAINSLPVIYSLKPSNLQINHSINMGLKDAITKGKVKLPINENEAKSMLIETADFLKKDTYSQSILLRPYIQVSALINEMIGLGYTVMSGNIKVYEIGSAKKDRFSSWAYSNFLADLLEKENIKNLIYDDDMIFMFHN